MDAARTKEFPQQMNGAENCKNEPEKNDKTKLPGITSRDTGQGKVPERSELGPAPWCGPQLRSKRRRGS
ncbi:hypothetical protein, partial [Streptomyces resistomycificus]|uniref:hypothetical protein n=1 Tax=Streptomyces resistomycificus TaxID=67356 RepID=UPI001ADFF877